VFLLCVLSGEQLITHTV